MYTHAHTHTRLPVYPKKELVALNRTSGSICLGNRDVVRYLYKILMSSCSNPLLKHQKGTVKSGSSLLSFHVPMQSASFFFHMISRGPFLDWELQEGMNYT